MSTIRRRVSVEIDIATIGTQVDYSIRLRFKSLRFYYYNRTILYLLTRPSTL